MITMMKDQLKKFSALHVVNNLQSLQITECTITVVNKSIFLIVMRPGNHRIVSIVPGNGILKSSWTWRDPAKPPLKLSMSRAFLDVFG